MNGHGGDRKSRIFVVDDEENINFLLDSALRHFGFEVGNARMHPPAGTPVTVTVEGNGVTARLTVTDDGPGMPPDVAAHVFERFYRADPSRSRGTGGAGLGLSIVKQLAVAHGGDIRAASEPGQGARFTVTLPVAPPS